MSFVDQGADYLAELKGRGGARAPTSLGEVWNAEWSRAGLDTFFGLQKPLADSVTELEDGIAAAAGKPVQDYAIEQGRNLGLPATIDQRIAMLGELADTFDDEQRKKLEPLKDARRRAAEKAQAIERDAADVANATYGLSGTATAFLAGTARQMIDPAIIAANVATAPLGGPFKGPLWQVLARQGVAGALGQAIVEPAIEAERAKLGLEAGLGRALTNIAESGIGSAGLAGVFRAAGWVARQGRRAFRGEGIVAGGSEVGPAPEFRASESRIEPEGGSSNSVSANTDLQIKVAPEDLDAAARLAERDEVLAADAPAVPQPEHLQRLDETAVKLEQAAPIEPEPEILTPRQMLVHEEIRESLSDAYMDASPGESIIDTAIANVRGEIAAGQKSAPNGAAWTEVLAELERRKAEHPDATINSRGDIIPREPVARIEPPKRGGPASRDPQTFSVFEFLASRGGLDPSDKGGLTGELAYILDRNPFVPGFGRLLRKGGLSLDRAWEALVEAGYINDAGMREGRVNETGINDALALIDAEGRGTRQYRMGYERPEKVDPAQRKAELEALRGELSTGFDARMAELEISKVNKADRTRALQIMEREGERDALAAYERALLERTDREEARRAARQQVTEQIPGWDVDEPRTAPRDGEGAARSAGGGRGDAGTGGGAREPGAGDREAQLAAKLGDPALAREAERALAENPDAEIYLTDKDGNPVKITARDALADAQEDARAVAELNDCIGSSNNDEVPF